ncbi:hypothetical protein NHH03_15170 [Stieleria sp. TO1_6]|uniref:hypothetical protein n=1 Tax=Stieleria tagensis TaxID=2956795 RepID=UPI00209B2A9D|nr:hypothetical protein [Stieleria tagensis]MCO8123087.1 hypothetical protein [Stieleria tagensis]
MKIAFSACLIASIFSVVGCVDGDEVGSAPSGPSVAVSYQSDPLADVEVSLHATLAGPVLAKAISASDGRAHFAEIPSPEPTEYFVALQSQGDGGWMLDSKFAKAAGNNLRLKPFAANDQQKIELPRGAIRPLTP